MDVLTAIIYVIASVLLIISFIIIICILIMNKIKDRSVYLKNISGPKPFSLLGNYFDYVGGTKVILKRFLEQLEKYGDTIIIHNGTFSWILITVDYEFTELLLKSTNHIDKSEQYTYFDRWLGQGLLTSTGSKWRSHRKAITPAFHFSMLPEYVGVFNNVGDVLVRKLEKDAGKDSVEISKILSLCALDVICEAAMGVKVNSLECETKYIKNIKTMCLIITQRIFSIVGNYLYPLTRNYFKEKKALKVIHNHVDNIIIKRIEKHQIEQSDTTNNNIGDQTDECKIKQRLAFLDLLLKSQINGRPLTKEELRDEVNTFMFEGHDTTSSAITFALLMIAEHQEVQEKVIKEQQEIFETDLKLVQPSYKQLNEMKYLDLVLKETLRLFPSVPYFGRKLSHDLDFKGTLYPKGIMVMVFPFAFQRNAKYFKEPEKFMPERFENQNGSLPYSYTPFSAGPRNCIGQKFAMLEMLSIVSKIVRNFELGPAKPEHQIELVSELILISKNGVRVSIRKRT